ncbi:nickel pincer cofactor biosynthesis protein LarC [Nodularia spumigena CS-591/04]|uniref:nickel pincer cofactor biosynthesis protein LarC n=1 Tax=Nodularia spumigena TaxID=70799 RepID=UPI00232AA33D|nr:nickel pincer cofactor biosynthesis protein LarC [Nodularia spumigena]MDB9320848.1 nickel pincer cofactor biosynthesis protein LarC [Nodularia spumigena CS-591/07A]MDB9330379.1 nickel pincer cofactor biosynthesis protein LarC [Nodularia spumigena CS-591/04]MDB9348344.1 nickel pincer cofactor biosynthesis protein LarC [Nodularia spumigena CS-588/01]MDB9351405.1 nickel pincer cofactor biosynthesis protein LarC [Nodularia spumigena CS-588/05]MDB9361987.1 nickel pincer cofactor biosynthesis pro
MIKLAYLQCPTGISGDMCLGALVSLGVPVEYLSETLNKLGIAQDYKLRVELVQRNGQQATKVHVDLLHDHHHHHEHNHHHGRHLPEIEKMILTAELPTRAEAWSLAVFRQLAVAEGAVHGIAPEKVHFHEVGAVDAIVDIVGTCLGLDWLGIASNDQGLPLLYCSALPTGGGTVRAAHGEMAVPVPAVLKLWEMRGCPVFSNGIEKELVTPTGAAIATTLATEFGSPPPMDIKQVGLGAGTINLPISNILRLWLGDRPNNSEDPHPNLETITVLETQIDDLNPQAIGYVFEALFAVGAVDVFTQPIGMKKSRPGILLTVICHPNNLLACETVLFRETTTLGIRRSTQQRAILQREIQSVEIEYGQVRVKVAWNGQEKNKSIVNIQPEYEDCADLARKHNIPWREVHRLALQTWYLQN